MLSNPNSKWMKTTKETMEKYHIESEDLEGSKERAKWAITHGIHLKLFCNISRESEGKSKLKYYLEEKMWSPEKPAKYMETLTRKQTSTIFRARTRMTQFKGNYKNKYPDQTCRACKKYPETHQHALFECETLKKEISTSITPPELTSEDTETVKKTAEKIDNICECLNKTE